MTLSTSMLALTIWYRHTRSHSLSHPTTRTRTHIHAHTHNDFVNVYSSANPFSIHTHTVYIHTHTVYTHTHSHSLNRTYTHAHTQQWRCQRLFWRQLFGTDTHAVTRSLTQPHVHVHTHTYTLKHNSLSLNPTPCLYVYAKIGLNCEGGTLLGVDSRAHLSLSLSLSLCHSLFLSLLSF